MVEYAIAGGLIVAIGTAVFTTLGQNVSSRISSLARLTWALELRNSGRGDAVRVRRRGR